MDNDKSGNDNSESSQPITNYPIIDTSNVTPLADNHDVQIGGNTSPSSKE